MKVEATALGYHNGRRRKGDQFEIRDEKHFSKRWMKKLDDPKAGKATAQVGDGDQPPPPKGKG